ncbi:hypothetical protein FB464_3847 [Subtercola boreus]|nr:hypothetical protein FB464_3847 [Subtercola boreus]
MGSNRRYADSVERQSLAKMNLRDMVGEPETLTPFELDLDNELVTYDPKPKKARAWVRYAGRPMKVNVYVLAWTRNCVRVRWVNGEKTRQEAWVWQPAVENTPWVEL